MVMMTDRNDNNSLQWCACVHGTLLRVLSTGRIGCGGGGAPVGCSDWLLVRGAVVFSPRGSQDWLYKESAVWEIFN